MRGKLILPFLFLCISGLQAQQSCPVRPAITPVSSFVNMFSDQQEVDLGDALAESISQRIKVIGDEQLTAHLRVVGDRIVKHLPPTNLNFRFYLVELPVVNAFSITGGRVYISRKMVALTQNEDELAGVLAHELGHIVTRQTAIAMTRNLRDTLGVSKVGDRADIFEKYHQYLENARRNPNHGRLNEEEADQYVADQVALYLMARAGYAPQAYVDLWDSFQQTHGKTGNWFSDLFGTTKPSQRRLREMVKNMGSLPPSCAEMQPASASAEFQKWRSEVIAYVDTGREQSLPGLLAQKSLALPLRPDISYFRYSPDGKYILAQDEAGLHVSAHDPLAQVFYIPAEEAYDAAFTPDSKSIIFYYPSLRVEKWSIPDQRRVSANEITTPTQCLQTVLSIDGLLLGCLKEDFELSLIDVTTSKTVLTKKNLYVVTPRNLAYFFFALQHREDGEPLPFIRMQFSPDEGFFVAAFDSRVIYDLPDHHESSLPGSIRELMNEEFTFLGADRILGINTSAPSKSQIVRFPSGERLDER
jgi:Peptidase family M48